jgi:hypothetical protein
MGNAAPPIKRLLEEQHGSELDHFVLQALCQLRGAREAQRRGGILHTARLTADELDLFWDAIRK